MSGKPTLYALLAKQARIEIANGDAINELRTLGTLSHFFDVFYNNEAFDETKKVIGDKNVGPSREYDFYYIRNNPEVFHSTHGKKISFAYPYNEEVFQGSYAFLVLNENWKRHLLWEGRDSERKLRAVYEGIAPKISAPILNVGQKADTKLINAQVSSVDVFEMRARTTGARGVFGYYGNLSRDLYPHQAFAAIERLCQESKTPANAMIVLAGKFRKGSEINFRHGIHLGSVPYEKMSALHAVTLANLTNESPLNHCLGNQKVIDSISCGVPMMCQKLDTFVEQLGDEYPCFYEDEDDAYRVARALVEDDGFLDYARSVARERAQYFRPEQVVARFLDQDDLRHFV